jgi:hypothetical protein
MPRPHSFPVKDGGLRPSNLLAGGLGTAVRLALLLRSLPYSAIGSRMVFDFHWKGGHYFLPHPPRRSIPAPKKPEGILRKCFPFPRKLLQSTRKAANTESSSRSHSTKIQLHFTPFDSEKSNRSPVATTMANSISFTTGIPNFKKGNRFLCGRFFEGGLRRFIAPEAEGATGSALGWMALS